MADAWLSWSGREQFLVELNADAIALGISQLLDSLSAAEVPVELEDAVEMGWESIDDTLVSSAFLQSYRGARESFPEVVDYEIAVNGRAIPDFDVDRTDPQSKIVLARRGLAVACSMLQHATTAPFRGRLASLVTVTPTLYNPKIVSGRLTFYILENVRTDYGQVDAIHDAVAARVRCAL